MHGKEECYQNMICLSRHPNTKFIVIGDATQRYTDWDLLGSWASDKLKPEFICLISATQYHGSDCLDMSSR